MVRRRGAGYHRPVFGSHLSIAGGLVNALVRPIAILLTFPITIMTMGFFLLIINAAMFGLVAAFLDNFTVFLLEVLHYTPK